MGRLAIQVLFRLRKRAAQVAVVLVKLKQQVLQVPQVRASQVAMVAVAPVAVVAVVAVLEVQVLQARALLAQVTVVLAWPAASRALRNITGAAAVAPLTTTPRLQQGLV